MNTYLLTWTTYGSWLPGDERGFVGHVQDSSGRSVIHNVPGEAYDVDEPRLRAHARLIQRGPAVRLTAEHANVCGRAFREAADRHGVRIHSAALMATHVHLVVSCEVADGAKLLNLFKGVSSRRLGQRFGKPVGTWWTRHGSRRCLPDDVAVSRAVRYVLEQRSALLLLNDVPEVASGSRTKRPAP